VVEVDLANRKVTIAHQDIPNFMPAMTMPFVVLEKDAVLLKSVSPGDEITATLVVPDTRYWIEDLVVVRRGTPNPNPSPVSSAPELAPGDALPDVALVDQDGKTFRLAKYRGQAVAVTFIYTRCPLPDYCPLMMKRFTLAEEALVRDPALAARTHLLTISFDIKHDTPNVLREFGRLFQKTTPPFTHWTLATGQEEAIKGTLQSFMDTMEYVLQLNSPALIEVTGDSARASSGIRESGKTKGKMEAFDFLGLYEDELVRTPEGWRFTIRTFKGLGSQTYPLTTGEKH
jgi:protein SCO1/2